MLFGLPTLPEKIADMTWKRETIEEIIDTLDEPWGNFEAERILNKLTYKDLLKLQKAIGAYGDTCYNRGVKDANDDANEDWE